MGCYVLLQGIFGTEPASLASPALAGQFFTTSATWETQVLTERTQVEIDVECREHKPTSRVSQMPSVSDPPETLLTSILILYKDNL